jgi:cation-transporting ATPase I
MELTRLLRKSAALPLRAAEAAANTTVGVITGSVRFAGTTAATVVGGGVALATAPVRTAAGLLSDVAESHSPGSLVREFVGGTPARRSSRGAGRAWIEVRGLHDPQGGPALADEVLSALRAQPGVTSAEVNYPLSRVVVCLDEDGPAVDLSELCGVIAEAENGSSKPAGGARERPIDLPGDSAVLVGRLVALTATSAGLCAALVGRALPWPRLPAGVEAAVTIVDYQPRVRRLLENRYGTSVTDTALAIACAAAYTATQAWASLGVEMVLQLSRVAESRAEQRAWAQYEPRLAGQSDCRDVFRATRPRPLPPGPVERHGDRSGLTQLVGSVAIGAVTRDINAAATAAVVAAPKAARTARECFASTLARGLSDDHQALMMRTEALRRLDRIDAVLIDPRALSVDDLRVSRIRGSPEHDRAGVWKWAQRQLESGAVTTGWNDVRGAWATNGNGRSSVQVLVRRAHHPLAAAVIGEARRCGAAVVSLDVDELDDLRSTFDDLAPVADRSLDASLANAVTEMQREGRTVLVLGSAAPQALSAADVAIGILGDDPALPWHAHVLVDDLAGAWRLLHALPAARAASRRGVEISTAASLLGALLMVPGVRGRGPGPVTAGAAAGLWTGYSLARRVLRAPAPSPAATYDWHAMTIDQVRRQLPEPVENVDGQSRRSVTKMPVAVPGRIAGSVRRAVWEFGTTLRDELSDPLTPVLATGSAASAVLGSPVDAVLVGSVLTFNSALAATQQVRAQRLLRRLLAVQVPSARKVHVDDTGMRGYVDVEAARLRPGEMVEIRPGEVIPADARLVECDDLEVDESTLTGESFPVAKQVDATPGAALAERSCMLFAATTVVAGTGVAIVTAVGPQTQVRRAAELPQKERGAVGLQTQLRELTNRAWPISLAGGGLVSALALLRLNGLREAVASGVAVTVAAVPEGLALVATLAQQASARRLTRLGALVRTPRSVEALGRVDVVCFDKTGTLSENRLRVTKVYPASTCSDRDVLTCAAQATPSPDDNGHHAHATDAAVTEAAGVSRDRHANRVAHLPFRSGRPFSATVAGEQLTLKGAPEVVLGACAGVGPALKRKVREMAGDGLRVIAVAHRTLTQEQIQTARDDSDALAQLCRGDLRLVGLLGLSDTPRAEAAGLLAALAAQDVGVRLITGDHPLTAAAIANELGIPVTPDLVISGSEWEALSRKGQETAVTERLVFARMSPENKVQVVETLERTGRVCAMVGDGANDAAAIRAATVGIGVAARGSDPARTAADVMLLDGRISSLLDALEEGRKLWLRVQAAVCVLLGGNAGEVVFAIIGSAITGRSPLNTRQLLLVNMLTDALPAAALAVSEPNGDNRPAGRGPDEAAIWRIVAVRGATTAAGATVAWTLASLTGRQRRASTVALVALVATQLGQTMLDSRSRLVVVTALGSLAAMAALVSIPGVSQLLGSTPLGPVGWGQALGSATAATLAAAVISRPLAQRRAVADSDAGQSPISTMPARQSTAYSSRNGMVKARATTSSGSELIPIRGFDTVPTVTET